MQAESSRTFRQDINNMEGKEKEVKSWWFYLKKNEYSICPSYPQ